MSFFISRIFICINSVLRLLYSMLHSGKFILFLLIRILCCLRILAMCFAMFASLSPIFLQLFILHFRCICSVWFCVLVFIFSIHPSCSYSPVFLSVLSFWFIFSGGVSGFVSGCVFCGFCLLLWCLVWCFWPCEI